MDTRFFKWFVYTVLIGLIPVFCRLLVWLVTKNGTIDPVAPSDFIVFGLVLHIANINEIEHLNGIGGRWKTFQNGMSVMFLVVYGLLFALTLNTASVDIDVIQQCVYVLCTVSFLLSFSVFYTRNAELSLKGDVA
jgi:hypothetical protein